MRTSAILAAILPAFLLPLLAPKTLAQPGYDDLSTLEWRTAWADLVLTATISSMHESTEGSDASTITVALEPVNVLKGTAPAKLRVSMPNSRMRRSVADGLSERMEAGHAGVWFLAAPAEGDTYGLIGERLFTAFIPLQNSPSVGDEESWIDRRLPPAVTMDLERLHTPAAILDALGRIAHEEPEATGTNAGPHGHAFFLSRAFTDPLWYESTSRYTITVPADARLESMARRMVMDPASFFVPLGSTASGHARRTRQDAQTVVRHEGAIALATHFQNKESAGLLVTLLDDPSVGFDRPTGLGQPHHNVYTLRAIAYDALVQWGIDVPRPQLEAPPVDIPTVPSPAAMHAVHGPHMEGLITTEFLIELGGDRTPELLRLTYLEAKGNPMARNIEDFRTGMTNPIAFTAFAFVEGEAIPIFHAGSDNDGIELQLRDFDGTPALVYQIHTKDPNVYACGWWNMFGQSEGKAWQTRAGHWKDDGRDIEFTGSGPLIWYGFSK